RAGPRHEGTGQVGQDRGWAARGLRLYGHDRGVRARRGPADLEDGELLGKSFDTFAPIGPCIATADEIPNPNDVHVQFWVDGQLRHNYNTYDKEHLVPELAEFATKVIS